MANNSVYYLAVEFKMFYALLCNLSKLFH